MNLKGWRFFLVDLIWENGRQEICRMVYSINDVKIVEEINLKLRNNSHKWGKNYKIHS